jgi:hypothetical protein
MAREDVFVTVRRTCVRSCFAFAAYCPDACAHAACGDLGGSRRATGHDAQPAPAPPPPSPPPALVQTFLRQMLSHPAMGPWVSADAPLVDRVVDGYLVAAASMGPGGSGDEGAGGRGDVSLLPAFVDPTVAGAEAAAAAAAEAARGGVDSDPELTEAREQFTAAFAEWMAGGDGGLGNLLDTVAVEGGRLAPSVASEVHDGEGDDSEAASSDDDAEAAEDDYEAAEGEEDGSTEAGDVGVVDGSDGTPAGVPDGDAALGVGSKRPRPG